MQLSTKIQFDREFYENTSGNSIQMVQISGLFKFVVQHGSQEPEQTIVKSVISTNFARKLGKYPC